MDEFRMDSELDDAVILKLAEKVVNAAEIALKDLKHEINQQKAVLWYQCHRYFYYVTMCVDAVSILQQSHLTFVSRSLRKNKLLDYAHNACRAFKDFCVSFPFAIPYRLHCEGRWEWAKKQKAKARKTWRQASEKAYTLGMFFVVGLVKYENMCHEPKGSVLIEELANETKGFVLFGFVQCVEKLCAQFASCARS